MIKYNRQYINYELRNLHRIIIHLLSAIILSSWSSLTVASILAQEKSLISRPSTMVHSPSLQLTGYEKQRSPSTPYLPPSAMTAMDTHPPIWLPFYQSCMCSQIAAAADAADDFPIVSMISLPLWATFKMYPSISSLSLKISLSGLPSMVA